MSSASYLSRYLEALSPFVGIDLVVDDHGICVLEVSPELSIQLEASREGGLRILSIFEEVAPGQLRSNMLAAALAYNGQCLSCHLAWSQQHSSLILQNLLDAGCSEEQVTQALVDTIEAALEWHDAIKRGNNWPADLQ